MNKCLLLLGALVIFTTDTTTGTVKEVSHEDIRDAILSLVHMFRENTDKLERHEYRERQLGDILKKSFSSVEKKQKIEEANITSVIATLSNIEKRLESMEKSLNKENEYATLEGTMKNIESALLTKIGLLEQNVQSNSGSYDVITLVSKKIDDLSESIIRIEEQSKSNTIIDDLNNTLSHIPQKLDQLNENILQINSKYAVIQDWNFRIYDFEKLTSNEIKMKLDNITSSFEVNCKKNDEQNTCTKFDDEKMSKIYEHLSNEQTQLNTILQSINTFESFYVNVQVGYSQLLKEIKSLSKIEQVLIQTADNVHDTKRRIEYGTHQILLEVGELVKQQAKDFNLTITKRFDGISSKILDNQNGGLTNLSSKIETEISQVWRQIGIMYQTLTSSAVALDRLQHQTELYVNGSLSTMDNMEGKVGQITSRMSEVDDNLNYLLGRLSLVTQEFNQIKTGLGDALDNIRSSFHTVQEKVKDVGPGPIRIPEQDDLISDQLIKTKYDTSK